VNNSQNNFNNDDGMAKGTLIASIVFSVIILVIISFFLYLLGKQERDFNKKLEDTVHFHQEDAAYKFTWVKNQLNQMQIVCREKDKLIDLHMVFEKRNLAKEPPVELLSKGGDCVIATEMPEFKQKEGEH
jgi:uncharacterized membrane protein YhiD involved in acid resistance